MARASIGKDATLTVILGRLRDPDAYLCGVLNNMILCKREYGSAVVRIGTLGEGRAPHYRVEPSESFIEAAEREIFASTPEEGAREAARTVHAYFTAYHGVSHKKLKWGFGELRDYSWSSRSMNIDKVQELIGKVRGYKPKGK